MYLLPGYGSQLQFLDGFRRLSVIGEHRNDRIPAWHIKLRSVEYREVQRDGQPTSH